jgi:hypothetical protein
MQIINQVIATDSGMFAIWDADSFETIIDYDSWAEKLENDREILEHIDLGVFVPINIQSDGAFQFVVRLGDADEKEQLSSREQKYVVVASEPYLLDVKSEIYISGIESIGNPKPPENLKIPAQENRHSVVIYMLDWEKDKADSNPQDVESFELLPDFVVLINLENIHTDYRKKIITFER